MRVEAWVRLAVLLTSTTALATGETEKAVVTAVLPLLHVTELAQESPNGVFFTQAANYGGRGGWGSGREAVDVSLRGPVPSPESLCRPQKGETELTTLPGAKVFQFFAPARPPNAPEKKTNSPFADKDWVAANASWRVVYPAHCAYISASYDGDDPNGDRVIGRVRALAEALHTQMVATGLAKGRVKSGKPLCDEALKFFKTDRVRSTHLRRDFGDLSQSFEAALQKYEAAHGTPPFFSVPPGGSASALNWLFAEGGTMAALTHAGDALSQDFVFTDRSEVKQLQGRSAEYISGKREARHGTEVALMQSIIRTSENSRRPLEPGEVFSLALEQVGGDGRLAMLLAHNTLRSLARGADGDLTGLHMDPSFYDKYLARIRGGPVDEPFREVTPTPEPGSAEATRHLDGPAFPERTADPFEGDNAGPWYHLFGTAYFEVQVQAELGSVVSDALSGERKPGAAPAGKVDPTRASQVANALEQYYRELLGGRVPDPEKYCVNVWGARLGAMFAQRYQTPGHRIPGPLGARTREEPKRPVNPLDPGLAEGTPRLGTPPPVAAPRPAPKMGQREEPLEVQLQRARAEKKRAFDEYTRLATEGGAGDLDAALEAYRSAQQRLKELEQQAARR